MVSRDASPTSCITRERIRQVRGINKKKRSESREKDSRKNDSNQKMDDSNFGILTVVLMGDQNENIVNSRVDELVIANSQNNRNDNFVKNNNSIQDHTSLLTQNKSAKNSKTSDPNESEENFFQSWLLHTMRLEDDSLFIPIEEVGNNESKKWRDMMPVKPR